MLLCTNTMHKVADQVQDAVIARLSHAGAEGVALGCTEIELLIGPDDVDVPVLATTRLHAEAAVEQALAG